MRTANYIFSVTSIVLGIAMLLFMLSQKGFPGSFATFLPWHWHIGVAIGVLLIINGAVRLWFAQDDH
jgi:cytochrome b561